MPVNFLNRSEITVLTYVRQTLEWSIAFFQPCWWCSSYLDSEKLYACLGPEL